MFRNSAIKEKNKPITKKEINIRKENKKKEIFGDMNISSYFV